MNNEHIHLFTPVEKWIDRKEGTYLFIFDHNSEEKDIDADFYAQGMLGVYNINNVTHVLDLSKLTTKEEAERMSFKRNAIA